MADVLSQAEIDKLLESLTSGDDPAAEEEEQVEAEEESVRVYDFRTADKFTKEQMRTLNIVFKSFGQLLSNQLRGLLRTMCEVEIMSLEELPFNEFTNSVPAQVALAIVETQPLEGSLIVQLSEETATTIVSRLFGATMGSYMADRQFTEVELAVMQRIFGQILKLFDQAWAKVINVRSKLSRIETNAQFAQIVELNEPVAVVTMKVDIENESGLINICLPYQALEPVAKQFNARIWYSGGASSKRIEPKPDYLMKRLENTQVELTAVFNDTMATILDIANLQPGDVIQLDHKVEEPVTLKFEDIPKFYCDIGAMGQKCAVKLIDTIETEGEEIDE